MLKNKNKVAALAIMLVLILITMSVTAFAAGDATTEAEEGKSNSIMETKEGKGFVRAVKDMSTFALIAGPSVCALAGMVCVIRMGMADEQDRKRWKDRTMLSIGCAVGVFIISGAITWITSYFK